MIQRALLVLIRVYQLTLSPLLGQCCRFEPSCSRYAAQCIELHGVLRGSWLALRRLLRCHPFNPGGYDPPPLAPWPRGSGYRPAPATGRRGQISLSRCRKRSLPEPSVQRSGGSQLSAG